MRYLIIVKATPASEAGMPDEEWMAHMEAYHAQLTQAGVLLDAASLQRSAQGWRVTYSGEQRQVLEGPFAACQGLIAGYTLIQVKSREEAMEWARRFPNPAVAGGEAEIEVRRLVEREDFPPGAIVDELRNLAVGQPSKLQE